MANPSCREIRHFETRELFLPFIPYESDIVQLTGQIINQDDTLIMLQPQLWIPREHKVRTVYVEPIHGKDGVFRNSHFNEESQVFPWTDQIVPKNISRDNEKYLDRLCNFGDERHSLREYYASLGWLAYRDYLHFDPGHTYSVEELVVEQCELIQKDKNFDFGLSEHP